MVGCAMGLHREQKERDRRRQNGVAQGVKEYGTEMAAGGLHLSPEVRRMPLDWEFSLIFLQQAL